MDYLSIDGDLKTQKVEVLKTSTIRERFKQFSLESHSGVTTSHVHSNNMMDTAAAALPKRDISNISDGFSPTADIADFLKRDTILSQFQWFPGNDVQAELQVWDMFLKNAAIRRKLENYSLVKGNMVITVLVNGSPFHEGMLMLSYRYLDLENIKGNSNELERVITRSQRPHAFAQVSSGKSCCICVPYVAPENYINLIHQNTDLIDLGRASLNSLCPLRAINSTESVGITIMCHLEDVVLTAPVASLTSLGGDESLSYPFMLEAHADEFTANGPISKPAASIAAVASKLTEIPVIGPLAKATQHGATSVGMFASYFGFSKPSSIEDVRPVRNTPVPSLALTDGADVSQKMSVTSKQELSIDPSQFGLPPEDPLALSTFTQRESIVDLFDWDLGRTPQEFIYIARVNPMYEAHRSTSDGSKITPTSLSFVSRLFEGWSGSINYRIQLVGTQYHRGRLVFFHSPSGLFTSDNMLNTCFGTIIDLSEGRDVTINVKYNKGVGYSLCEDENLVVYRNLTNDLSFASSPDKDNGLIGLMVLNELKSPDQLTPVRVVVSISAGDDFELVNPTSENMYRCSPFEALSGSVTFPNMFSLESQAAAIEVAPEDENAPEGTINTHTLNPSSSTPQEKPMTFYGERVLSLRQLLKRYNFYRRVFQSSNVNSPVSRRYAFLAMPEPRGYDQFGPDETIDAFQYRFVGPTLIAYLYRAFGGWRGSIRYKFMPQSEIISMRASRRESATARSATQNYRSVVTGTTIKNNTNVENGATQGIDASRGSLAGTVMTQNRTLDVLDLEVPFAIPYRFCRTGISGVANTIERGIPNGNRFDVTVQNSVDLFFFDMYVAAGEDFTFLAYIGAPQMYFYGDPEPKV